MMTQLQGTIIRTPGNSPGLLVVDGRQKTFTLEGVWKSPVAPAVNMAIEIELDDGGSIRGLTARDSQQVAREKLNQIGGAAQQHGKEAAEIARRVLGNSPHGWGRSTMGAAIIHAIAWFSFPALTLGENFSNAARTLTLWNLVGIDPNTNSRRRLPTTVCSPCLAFWPLRLRRGSLPPESEGQIPLCRAPGLFGDRRFCNLFRPEHLVWAPLCKLR